MFMPLQSIRTSGSSENANFGPLHRFPVLGVPVAAIQIPEVVGRIEHWIQSGTRGRYVAVTGMHGIAESRADGNFRHALHCADLVVPDGMPLVWLGRARGHEL